MRLLQLATRNLFRNARRTLLTLVAISFGLALMVFIINLQYGRYGSWIDAGISSPAGHVVIQALGYQDGRKPTLVVEGVGVIADTLRDGYPDAVVAPRIFLGGMLNSTTDSASAVLTGLDPVAERQVQDLHEKVVDGGWLERDSREIVIGCEMAETLNVGLGDKLVYMGQNGTDEVQARLFRVKGIFRTGAASLDGRVTYVHLAAAQELLGGGDMANMVTLHLQEPAVAFEAAPRIEAALARPELDVRHWRDALPDVFAMIEMDQAACDWSLGVVALLVAFGVLNTMLMSTLERTREFGVMLALGLKPRQLAGLVLLEGLVLGVLGALVGLLLGATFSSYAIYHGLDYGANLGGETMEQGGVIVDTVFYGAWYPLRMGLYSAAVVLFCVFAAIYPAWSISRLQPVQALRHH